MQLRNKQDFWAGAMFTLLGLGFAFIATQYQMGTSARMGPGYFPFWLGICLAVLGAVVALGAMSPKATKTTVDRFDFKILFIIIGSVILFGALLRPLGLYLSLFLLVMASSVASYEYSFRVALVNAIFLVVFCWLAFIKGLGLIFPLWPSFLGMN
ncbi:MULTISPECIES: tripartite tricarboxylate transporter TctB family protein [unclassified Bordetella]|uniref:tripartite tricarboxylate transporter TctB family protein n=1 Tax=unclassified Bordetella TaxID=2630031 RepID=UPI001321C60A|nr:MULTISPECIES: tripartite tricarboxylate transporter TctB family protein [unclassified Bordetella]MVW71463.1 tripartite tricarboxylate transporter TctB family protein [Bordetella sp. 15P40C-2]MVW79320.1 tripartite tricarboxylate transporter TctB family protein [Bordetella sp. 02P26C-1]